MCVRKVKSRIDVAVKCLIFLFIEEKCVELGNALTFGVGGNSTTSTHLTTYDTACYDLLNSKVYIIPGATSLSTENIVAILQFSHIQLILTG